MRFFGRSVSTILAILVAGIPTWMFLLLKVLLDPQGFWQKFIVFGLGLYFLGVLQLILFVVLIAALFIIWGNT